MATVGPWALSEINVVASLQGPGCWLSLCQPFVSLSQWEREAGDPGQ